MKNCFNKKRIFILVVVLYSSLLNAKELIKITGKLEGLNSQINNPEYSLQILCPDDTGVFVNNIYFIKKDAKINIKYTPAHIKGTATNSGGQTSQELKTFLYINGKEQLLDEITISERNIIELRAGNRILLKAVFFPTDSIYFNDSDNVNLAYIAFHTGMLDLYEGVWEPDANETFGAPQYFSLKILGTNCYGNNGKWYCAKDNKISLTYQPAAKHGGYGSISTATTSYYKETRLLINGRERKETELSWFINETTTIQLIQYWETRGSGSSQKGENILYEFTINFWNEETPKPKFSEEYSEDWISTAKLVKAITEDVSTPARTSYMEYCIRDSNDGEIQKWEKGSSCVVDIENGTAKKKYVSFRNIDCVGNISEPITQCICIDKKGPEFSYYVEFNSVKKNDVPGYKREFTIGIENIIEDSGIKDVSIKPILNSEENDRDIIESKNGKYIFPYEIQNCDIDYTISFLIITKDKLNNITEKETSKYFVPAVITINPQYIKDNKVKVNFYDGNKRILILNKGNSSERKYEQINLQRIFYLPEKNNQNAYKIITEDDFGNTDNDHFNISIKSAWENLKAINNINLTTENNETCYVDSGLENTGFTHKAVSYTCKYKYKNPVDGTEVEEVSEKSTIVALTNNQAEFFLKITGDENTSIILDKNGNFCDENCNKCEDNSNAFKMPETGIVGVSIKVTDIDIEPCGVEVTGWVEMKSPDGKLKLKENEADRNALGASGGISGCGQFKQTKENKTIFMADTPGSSMTGYWVNLGNYYLQYNITNVLKVTLTEGFPGGTYTQTEESAKLYIAAPTVMGGKTRLLVGKDLDDISDGYDATGITARPWQPLNFELEILDEELKRNKSMICWDFGNGVTSNNYSNYDYRFDNTDNPKFNNVTYSQSDTRTGAVSEYILKITAGSDDAEFNVHILDTQFGTLYGNEVWRGDHIIKKEIIVPSGKTLQIGDTESLYNTDIKCLCVGKQELADKAGITVEHGAKLVFDEDSKKTIELLQGNLIGDKYEVTPEKDKSWQNMWKGIKVEGILEGGSFSLSDAMIGIELKPNSAADISGTLNLLCCENGVLMQGEHFTADMISLLNCTNIGFQTNKKSVCNEMTIDSCKRGLVLFENGEINIQKINVVNSLVGLHILGGKAIIDGGNISNCSEYGIKFEGEGFLNYDGLILENNERNIYVNGIIK